MSIVVSTSQESLRCAFVGVADDNLHVPATADTRLFIDASGVTAEVNAWNPDFVFVFNPQQLTPKLLGELACDRVFALIGRPVLTSEDAARLLAPHRSEALAPIRYTYFEPSLPSALSMPVRDIFPLPFAGEYCRPPRGAQIKSVAFVEWARPPQQVINAIAKIVRVAMLDHKLSARALHAAVADHDLLIYWGAEPIGVLDRLPLSALAQGVLLMSSAPFVSTWGIEPADEYIIVSDENVLLSKVALAIDQPATVHAVRVRAWQRMTESFLAKPMFARLIADRAIIG